MSRPEDEYSYPPEPRGVTTEDLLALGVQVAPPSKRRVATTRLYTAPLSDETIAGIRAKVKGDTMNPLVLSFHGPNWIAQLTLDGFELYTSKSCTTRKHALALAFRWAKGRGYTIGQVVS